MKALVTATDDMDSPHMNCGYDSSNMQCHLSIHDQSKIKFEIKVVRGIVESLKEMRFFNSVWMDFYQWRNEIIAVTMIYTKKT